jgi:hypothetical protein
LLRSLSSIAKDPHYSFERADVRDPTAMSAIFAKYRTTSQQAMDFATMFAWAGAFEMTCRKIT